MKKIIGISAAFLLVLSFFYFQTPSPVEIPSLEEGEREEHKAPDDWLYNQRTYPNNSVDITAYRSAVKQTKQAKGAPSRSANEWELVGPTNTGGRVTDIILHPTNTQIMYAGASVGGVFKSVDGGASWVPIFDEANSLSIGNLAISPADPDVLYVGTGEANGSATSGAFFGDGIYKSEDGGASWDHMGLENSQHIGRIAIDPLNDDRIYVAAAGLLYGKSE
ncbi:MAG: hypothetical protein AAF985_11460, partial [Bacteroidota bacterium]